MTPQAAALLACPLCHGQLQFEGLTADNVIAAGAFLCARCPTAWPVAQGLPNFVREANVSWLEHVTRWTYDHFAAWHDPAIEWLLPLLQGTTEPAGRDFYIERLKLDALRPTAGQPLRILEVGCGTGANLPAVERHVVLGRLERQVEDRQGEHHLGEVPRRRREVLRQEPALAVVPGVVRPERADRH